MAEEPDASGPRRPEPLTTQASRHQRTPLLLAGLLVVVCALIAWVWNEAEKVAPSSDAARQTPATPDRGVLMRVDELITCDPVQALALLQDPAIFPPERRDLGWHFYREFCRRACAEVLGSQRSGIPCVAFSPDGKQLASGGRNGTVQLWDMATRTGRILPGIHARWVLSLAWAPDGSLLASGGLDGKVILWDPAGLQYYTFDGPRSAVMGLAWDRGGRLLYSASRDGSVHVWDTDELREMVNWQAAKALLALALSRDGRTLATSGSSTITMWDTATQRPRSVLEGHAEILHDLAFSPDGKTLASGSADGSVRLWETVSGKALAGYSAHPGGANAVAWHPQGRMLASAGADQAVRIWNTSTGQEQAILRDLPKAVMSLSWSPDGSTLAIGCFDNFQVHLWQPFPTPARWTLDWRPFGFGAAVMSRDGRWVASPAAGQGVVVFNARTNQRAAALSPASLTAGSPDGRWQVAVRGGSVLISEKQANANPLTLPGHAAEVTALLWSVDSKTLATADAGGTVRLWEAATGELRAVLRGHTERVAALAWSDDARFLVSRDASGVVRLWQVGPDS